MLQSIPNKMFDILRSVKRITGLDKKKTSEEQPVKESAQKKIDKLSSFFSGLFENAVNEFGRIHEKTKNLKEANFNLGMKYLEEGNIKEAAFRFKFTKKFWPEYYEAYYQLIVCLTLLKKFQDVEKIKQELLDKAPNYKEKIDYITQNEQPISNPNA
ncbi:MAG: tetratricopeptide (TPR) repeat protein [Lentimonas sp.]|jgi:tetratricopeptide (TPR) repeat protein